MVGPTEREVAGPARHPLVGPVLEGDLERLLDEGRLGGVGLDVFDHETCLADALRGGKPDCGPEARATLGLARRDNVILTPHNAFNTAEAVARKALHSIRQIEHFMKQGGFLWPVPIE